MSNAAVVVGSTGVVGGTGVVVVGGRVVVVVRGGREPLNEVNSNYGRTCQNTLE